MSGAGKVAAFLERFDVRIVLTIAILASLVPHAHESITDAIFFGLFAVEVVLRAIAIFAPARASDDPAVRTTKRRVRRLLLLSLDVAALLTFTPVASVLTGAPSSLRLLRLGRLMLLFGYWSPTLRQGLAVVSRQDRLRQILVLGGVALLVAFAGGALLAHLPADIDFDGDGAVDEGDGGFGARLWWSMRQVLNNGNALIESPDQFIVVIVSLVLTLAGVFVVSFLIGLATDIVRELVDSARDRAPGWRGHTVVIHTTPGLPRLLSELSAYYERLFRRPRFILTDASAEAPDGLDTTELSRVRWRTIDERGTELAQKTDLAEARRVVVLAKPEAPFPDAHLAAMVLNVRDANSDAWVVAEVLDPANVAATRVAGGGRTVVIATEQLLALWALAVVRRPEQIGLAHELVASRAGREIYTFFFEGDGLDHTSGTWDPSGATIADLSALARDGGGTAVPLGVVRGDGSLLLNPPPREPLGSQASPVQALVAIADHFDDVKELAERAKAGVRVAPPASPSPPRLGPAQPARRPKRILVGGFRPATMSVCAALLAEDPQAIITLVQRHEETIALAHEAMLTSGLPGEQSSRLTIVRADWSGERMLLGLEAGVGRVETYDLVLLLGSHHPEYDGRTAMAVLKIADQLARRPQAFAPDFTVVAGVADVELGRRLKVGFERACGRGLQLIETEEMRALFVFQAIAVPAYAELVSELVGPGGEGFVRYPVTAQRADMRWTFEELATALRPARYLLIGVELGERRVLDPSVPFDEAELAAVWVLADERTSVN